MAGGVAACALILPQFLSGASLAWGVITGLSGGVTGKLAAEVPWGILALGGGIPGAVVPLLAE